MNFETYFVSTPPPVTVLTTHGDIDGSNYRDLISAVQKLMDQGTRNLLLDLGDTGFVSSSGLAALHSIALLLNGKPALNLDEGWAALRQMGHGLDEPQEHLKLLNVQPRVEHTLDISGFKSSIEIFSDRTLALASFAPR